MKLVFTIHDNVTPEGIEFLNDIHNVKELIFNGYLKNDCVSELTKNKNITAIDFRRNELSVNDLEQIDIGTKVTSLGFETPYKQVDQIEIFEELSRCSFEELILHNCYCSLYYLQFLSQRTTIEDLTINGRHLNDAESDIIEQGLKQNNMEDRNTLVMGHFMNKVAKKNSLPQNFKDIANLMSNYLYGNPFRIKSSMQNFFQNKLHSSNKEQCK